jgi:hypothetical protein
MIPRKWGEVDRSARLQLPLGPRSAVTGELQVLARALGEGEGEQLIRIATGHIDGRFGVLAVTSDRVLWISGGGPGSLLRAWSRSSVGGAPDGEHSLAIDGIQIRDVTPAAAADEIRALLERPLAQPA